MTYNFLDEKELYKESVLIPWWKQKDADPLMIKDADGVFITLKDQKKLLDMKSQAFCANLGHNHRGMINAMVESAKKAVILSSDAFHEARLSLAQALKQIAPKSDSIELTKVFYTLGGAEANENAIKIARMFTKRHKIITRYRSYHGATLATINMSGDYRRIAVDSGVSGIVRFPDPYERGSRQKIDTVKLLEEIIEIEGPETIAAILLEGITGANGVFIPPSNYWSQIREICDCYGILLICDEVFSGFFRTGTWFGINHFNVVPDIITMSKGLTAGYMPLGACMVNGEIADFFEDETLWCGLTQYGHPLACATACAAIEFYKSDNIAHNVAARGQELKEMLLTLKHDHKIIAETRSIGLLAAIDLKKSDIDDAPLVPYRAMGKDLEPAKILQSEMVKAGIYGAIRYSTILLAPPLIISKQELKDGILGVDNALKALYERLPG
jgi:taurine---2-oxoglutarate transaminase